VHHDLWDYDFTTAPKLLTVRHNGKSVDVPAQASKQGFLYVFDRVTGGPLWPIEERPVPKSDMPQEESWPTQPFPTAPPPFARQKFTIDDLNPYIEAEERERMKEIFRGAHAEGIFTPPAFNRNQIAVPGENGRANWARSPTQLRSYTLPTTAWFFTWAV
jgi:quinoprotein glucose dehydrogenase